MHINQSLHVHSVRTAVHAVIPNYPIYNERKVSYQQQQQNERLGIFALGPNHLCQPYTHTHIHINTPVRAMLPNEKPVPVYLPAIHSHRYYWKRLPCQILRLKINNKKQYVLRRTEKASARVKRSPSPKKKSPRAPPCSPLYTTTSTCMTQQEDTQISNISNTHGQISRVTRVQNGASSYHQVNPCFIFLAGELIARLCPLKIKTIPKGQELALAPHHFHEKGQDGSTYSRGSSPSPLTP